MIDFSDEQKMAQKVIRSWAEKELAPLVKADPAKVWRDRASRK